MKRRSFLLGFAMLSPSLGAAAPALFAFPGAEGFGRYARGGRGGNGYPVVNLNDGG